MVATRTAKPALTKDLTKAREAASRSRRLKELERIAKRKEELLRLIAPQQEKCKQQDKSYRRVVRLRAMEINVRLLAGNYTAGVIE